MAAESLYIQRQLCPLGQVSPPTPPGRGSDGPPSRPGTAFSEHRWRYFYGAVAAAGHSNSLWPTGRPHWSCFGPRFGAELAISSQAAVAVAIAVAVDGGGGDGNGGRDGDGGAD